MKKINIFLLRIIFPVAFFIVMGIIYLGNPSEQLEKILDIVGVVLLFLMAIVFMIKAK